MMTVSRLLKSCATPPVSWPIASIFCAWSRAARGASLQRLLRASRRSVTSRVILAKPISVPSSSRIASMTTLAQKRVPSLRTRQPSASNLPSRAAVSRARAGMPAARSSSV